MYDRNREISSSDEIPWRASSLSLIHIWPWRGNSPWVLYFQDGSRPTSRGQAWCQAEWMLAIDVVVFMPHSGISRFADHISHVER